MSHKHALAASIALTLFLALGVVAARDRFLTPKNTADLVPIAATQSVETTEPTQRTQVTPPRALQSTIRSRVSEASDDDRPASVWHDDDNEDERSSSSRYEDDDDEDEEEDDEYEDEEDEDEEGLEDDD